MNNTFTIQSKDAKVFDLVDNLDLVDNQNSVDNNIKSLQSQIDRICDKLFSLKVPTQYIFINKECRLGFGKAVAQACHSQETMLYHKFKDLNEENIKKYLSIMDQNPRCMIILEAKNEQELYNIQDYLKRCGIFSEIYVDETGTDYVMKATALCTEYVEKDDPKIRAAFKGFNLFIPEPTVQEIQAYGLLNEMKRFMNDEARLFSNKEFRQEIYEMMEKWNGPII